MTTLDISVIDGDDDAEEKQNDSGFSPDGAQEQLVSHSSSAARSILGFRFQNVTVPAGATIDVAHISISQESAKTGDDINCDVFCEDVDDADDYATDADLVNRVTTTASTSWVADDVGSGTFAQSPSIVSAVQEVVDRGSWSSGNALNILLIGKSDATKAFWCEMFEDSGTAAALHIEYTAGGAADLSVSESQAVTVGETATLDPVSPTNLSESEALSVGEAVTARLSIEVAPSDAITVSDTAALDPVSPTELTASEDLTVGEAQVVTVSDPQITEIEAITVGESVSIEIPTGPSVEDSVTVGEDVTVQVDDPQISESEAVSLSDSPTVNLIDESALSISVADAVSVGESVGFLFDLWLISVSDAVAVGESVSVGGLAPEVDGGGDWGPKTRKRVKRKYPATPMEKTVARSVRMTQEYNERLRERQEAEQQALEEQKQSEGFEERVSQVMQRERQAEEEALRRRAVAKVNLRQAQKALEAKRKKEAEIQKKRVKALKKARAAKAKRNA